MGLRFPSLFSSLVFNIKFNIEVVVLNVSCCIFLIGLQDTGIQPQFLCPTCVKECFLDKKISVDEVAILPNQDVQVLL